MNGDKKTLSIFYFYLHSKLKKRDINLVEEMEISELCSRMFQWRIPTCLKPLIIKEMELLGLIRKIDNKKLELLPSKFNINDVRCYYQQLGIY
jgi:hypothetical protein